MSSPAVPSIPPLSSVVDPNARAVLQAMVDGQRIRNGDVGTGDEKFLTVADLTAGVSGVYALGSAGLVPKSKVYNAVTLALRKLSNQIMQSRTWKLLDESVARIETPEWFAGRFGAAIKTEQTERITEDAALEQQITTAVTNIQDNIALVQQSVATVSDQAGATAKALTSVQTSVGEIDAAAQEALSLSGSVDETLHGTWSVKFDVNGYIAGVAMGVGKQPGQPPKSNFVVRADTFAVGSPGSQDVVPFFVNGGYTYINKAMISDASIDRAQIAFAAVQTAHIDTAAVKEAQIAYAAIHTAHIADLQVTTAKIGDLQVDTLKIADNAVTTTTHVLGADAVPASGGTWTTIASVYVDVGAAGSVSLAVSVTTPSPEFNAGGDYGQWLYFNALVRVVAPSGTELCQQLSVENATLIGLGRETGTYTLQEYTNYAVSRSSNIHLVAFVGKK